MLQRAKEEDEWLQAKSPRNKSALARAGVQGGEAILGNTTSDALRQIQGINPTEGRDIVLDILSMPCYDDQDAEERGDISWHPGSKNDEVNANTRRKRKAQALRRKLSPDPLGPDHFRRSLDNRYARSKAISSRNMAAQESANIYNDDLRSLMSHPTKRGF